MNPHQLFKKIKSFLNSNNSFGAQLALHCGMQRITSAENARKCIKNIEMPSIFICFQNRTHAHKASPPNTMELRGVINRLEFSGAACPGTTRLGRPVIRYYRQFVDRGAWNIINETL
jgi:hypothetical protein